jgi:hypothetical protein
MPRCARLSPRASPASTQKVILAQACAHLIALGTRFSYHGQGHNLNLLFAELDAFKTHFSDLSSSAQSPSTNTLSSQTGAVDNNLHVSVAFDDRIASAATCNPSFIGLGQCGLNNVDINFTKDPGPHLANAEESARTSQGLPSAGAATFVQNLDGANAGAWQIDDSVKSPNEDRSAQAGLDHDTVPQQAPNPNASLYHSAGCFAPTDNYWDNNDWNDDDFNNFFDFGASNTQDLDIINSPTVDQRTNLAGNSSNVPPSSAPVSATATGPTRGSFQCSHCAKTFLHRKDLNRHALSHDPNATRHYCPSSTCNRYFLRKDKLTAHRRSKRH